MADRTESEKATQRVTMEINRIVDTVNAEIARRKNETTDEIADKRNRRFAAAKAAQISEAADVARDGARQLDAAKRRVLDEVADATAAGFTVQEDFSVVGAASRGPGSTTEADARTAAIQAAVGELVALDEQVATRLNAAAKDLQDLGDN